MAEYGLKGYKMITPYIDSKGALKKYIKRKLGEPTIKVAVTDDQMNDAINDSIELFIERALDGSQLRFGLLNLEAGKNTYKLDYDCQAVLHLYSLKKSSVIDSVTDQLPHEMSMFYQQASFDILTFVLTNNYVDMVEKLLSTEIEFNFNSITKELYIFQVPKRTYKAGFIYYKNLDFEKNEGSVYNNRWIKTYALELCREQWGMNMIKYTSPNLPGRVTMNGERILDEAKERLERLNEQLREEWELPAEFFVG